MQEINQSLLNNISIVLKTILAFAILLKLIGFLWYYDYSIVAEKFLNPLLIIISIIVILVPIKNILLSSFFIALDIIIVAYLIYISKVERVDLLSLLAILCMIAVIIFKIQYR